MTKSDKEALYADALQLWGAEAQANMAIEEASEFIKAICKVKRDNTLTNYQLLYEEMADLEIMLEQVKSILCCYDDVELWKQTKLERLRGLVDKAKEARKID